MNIKVTLHFKYTWQDITVLWLFPHQSIGIIHNFGGIIIFLSEFFFILYTQKKIFFRSS